jgi:outer membrane autotransporter protein
LIVDGSTVTGTIWNQAGGTVTGATEDSIYLKAGATVGNILNDGRIVGNLSFNAVIVENSTVTGSIINSASGVISGASDALALSSGRAESITNAGAITARITGIGIYNSGSTVTGNVVNSSGGTITAHTGIAVSSGSVSGMVVNSGVISAVTVINGPNTFLGTGIYANSTATIGGITNSGLITSTGKSLNLENTASAFIVNNTGTLSGVANIGINTLNLNGTSSRVIGNTTGTGTVNVNGSFSSEGTFGVGTFNIASAGLFNMANGVTVGGGNFNNSGTLNVGSTSQTVTGNYTQSAGGVYRMGLTNATSNYGKLNVTGTANIAGGVNVVINGSPALTNGTTIAGVITSTGAMTVTPANIAVTDNSMFYNFTAATVSNPGHALDLVITVDANALPNAVGPNNPAAAGVAQNLQNIFNAGVPAAMQPVFDRLGSMTPTQVSDALSQTLPVLVGAGAQAGISALHSMNKLIQSRVESNQGLSSGDDSPDKYMWLRGFGSNADQLDHNNVSGFRSRTNGFGIGGDAPINERVRAGGAITYAKSEIKGNSVISPNVMDADTYELVGYASYNLDPQTDINYQIDIGQNKVKSTRQIGFMGTTAQASFDSLALHGSAGIGRTLSLAPSTNVTPSVRLDYTVMRTDGYTETGAGPLNLMVDASTYKEFLLTGDAKIAHQVNDNFKLVGNVSVGYDFLNQQSTSVSAFVGGGSVFESKGLEVSPWVYRAALGAIYDNKKGLEYSARYDAEGRTSGYLNQTLSAKLRWAF